MTTPQDPDFDDPEFLAELAELRRGFIAGLPARREALVEAWAHCADAGEEAAWLRLREVAHKLSGSAANYGLDELGLAGRALDRLLSGRTPCRTRDVAAAPVARLRALLDAAIAAG